MTPDLKFTLILLVVVVFMMMILSSFVFYKSLKIIKKDECITYSYDTKKYLESKILNELIDMSEDRDLVSEYVHSSEDDFVTFIIKRYSDIHNVDL